MDTPSKILDLAEHLFEQHSFNGFSYADIAKPLGIKNAAIHYYFPNKSDLGLALIKRYRERFASYSQHLNSKYGHDVLRLFDGYVAIPKSFLKMGDLSCPLSVFNSDYQRLPQPMREEIRLLAEEIRHWLHQILESGKQSNIFRYNGMTEDRVLLIMASLQGAMSMARSEGSDYFDRVVIQLKLDLGIKEAKHV